MGGAWGGVGHDRPFEGLKQRNGVDPDHKDGHAFEKTPFEATNHPEVGKGGIEKRERHETRVQTQELGVSHCNAPHPSC